MTKALILPKTGHNQDCFQNAYMYLMVMPAETLATTKEKNCGNVCFCPSKYIGIHKN